MNSIRKTLLAILVPMLLTLLLHQTASAYYDPGVQRWINRDPLEDPGSWTHLMNFDRDLSMRPNNPVENWQGPNLYRFARNASVGLVDKDGRVIPLVIGGVVITIGTAEAVAATFGLSVAACLATPPCAKALRDALRQALDNVISRCRPVSRADPDKERCQKVRRGCIDECSDSSLPTRDHGWEFQKCMRRCMEAENCPY
jgi:hypothetical protein